MYKSLYLLWLAAVLPTLAWGAEIREYPCYRLTSEPVIDGKLDDAVWSTVPPCHGFLVLGDGCVPVERQTSFRMGWTGKGLFVAMECADPHPEKLTTSNAGDRRIWEDDSVELFLFPKGQATYRQFVVNAAGIRWNSGGELCDWTARTVTNEHGWTCEMRIPLEVLRSAPRDGEKWRLNVARNMVVGTEPHSCWVRSIHRSFHEVDGFGGLIFREKALSQDEASRLGGHLGLKRYFQEQIKILAKVRMEYRDVMEQGMQFKEFRQEVLAVQQGWDLAEEMAGKEEPSLQAVYECWEQCRILEERTRKLPLRVDMEKLFEK